MHTSTLPGLSIPHTYTAANQKLTIPGLTTLPEEIFDFADDITILDLSGGHLTGLPNDLHRLYHLSVIFLSKNDFTEIPAVLATCGRLKIVGIASCKLTRIDAGSLPADLEALIVTDNQITEISPSIGKLKNLRKLTATGNHLAELPHELLACTQLELLRLSANQFEVLPTWLFELPNLAWYADAGNPGSPTLSTQSPRIDWTELDLGEKLGASTKNTVYAATIRRTGQEIAVKVFGNTISADGYPADEVAAYLATGTHPALVRTVAEITHTPNDKRALALAKIPSEYTDLGDPPTLQTVTRDTYPTAERFTTGFIVRVLCDVSSALAHIHSKNLMHGDVYAHNILSNQVGTSFLVDFGAASFYTPVSDNRHELVEIKAFGHLMEELLQHVSVQTSKPEVVASLQTLRTQCLSNSYLDRPTFAHIRTTLQNLHV